MGGSDPEADFARARELTDADIDHDLGAALAALRGAGGEGGHHGVLHGWPPGVPGRGHGARRGRRGVLLRVGASPALLGPPSCPVLGFFGGQDPWVPLGDADAMEAAHPGAVVRYPEAGSRASCGTGPPTSTSRPRRTPGAGCSRSSASTCADGGGRAHFPLSRRSGGRRSFRSSPLGRPASPARAASSAALWRATSARGAGGRRPCSTRGLSRRAWPSPGPTREARPPCEAGPRASCGGGWPSSLRVPPPVRGWGSGRSFLRWKVGRFRVRFHRGWGRPAPPYSMEDAAGDPIQTGA